MKYFGALLTLLLVFSSSQTLRAQAADSWVSVPLEGDQLTVQMPKRHEVKSREFSFEQFKVEGHVYTATEDGVDYSVWSLVDKADPIDLPPYVSYLDYCADLVWESLLKPRRDQLPQKAQLESRMSYATELSWSSPEAFMVSLGREYSIMLGNRPGKTQVYVAGRRIYILIVLNEDANSAAAQRFVNSFSPKKEVEPKLPRLGTEGETGRGRGGNIDGGVGPGQGGNIGGGDAPLTAANGPTDYNRVFKSTELTQKARVLSKPEPSYTESARKYGVQGTVALIAVFSRSGEVTGIRVVTALPHGLTAKAIGAARQMKFRSAQKDGHEVSTFVRLEYNFNLY